jgi:tetratricopeptide (TPR) repeat protein
MKKGKRIAAIAALLALGTLLWAAPRPAEEFDKEAEDYKNYWFESVQKHKDEKFGQLLLLDDLRAFCNEHPQCLLSRVDLATESLKARRTKEGVEALKAASKILPSVPETEEGKFAKAKYYRLSAEVNLFITPGGNTGAFLANGDAMSCTKYNELLGAQIYYLLGNYYASAKNYRKALFTFKTALKYDKKFELLAENDLRNIVFCIRKSGGILEFELLDNLVSNEYFTYFPNYGSIMASGFDFLTDKSKAALVSILDKEYADTYNKTSADELLAVLRKNFSKSPNAEKCIAFIEKFYDDSQTFTEEDLKLIPKSVREFMPLRYMYKMKTSDDIAALREEFEPFFTTIGNFYIRLYEKAEKAGDKKHMAELKEILSKPIHNANGKNRL